MPGAALLGDQPVDRAVLVDDVMRADLGGRVGQAVERGRGARHARVVQHQHVDGRAGRTRFAIGRGALDHRRSSAACAAGVIASASFGRRSTMMATPRMVMAPPSTIRQVSVSPSTTTPDTTPNTGPSKVHGMVWLTGWRRSSQYHRP